MLEPDDPNGGWPTDSKPIDPPTLENRMGRLPYQTLIAQMAATIAAGLAGRTYIDREGVTRNYDMSDVADESVDLARRILARVEGEP